MLANDGRVTITDFGIARAWQPSDSPTPATNEFVGTPEYMSPEQAEGGAIDLRTDIYSLGVMLFELLTGTGAVHRRDAAHHRRGAANKARAGSAQPSAGSARSGRPGGAALHVA